MNIIRIQFWSWSFEDYKEDIYLLKTPEDIEKVNMYLKKLKDKYKDNYKYWEWSEAMKKYITRTLKWTYINNLWVTLEIN